MSEGAVSVNNERLLPFSDPSLERRGSEALRRNISLGLGLAQVVQAKQQVPGHLWFQVMLTVMAEVGTDQQRAPPGPAEAANLESTL